MILVKLPVPVPSSVLLSFIVGFWLMLQHTPLTVTVAPPSSVITPPDTEDVWVISTISVVDSVGASNESFSLQLLKKH